MTKNVPLGFHDEHFSNHTFLQRKDLFFHPHLKTIVRCFSPSVVFRNKAPENSVIT